MGGIILDYLVVPNSVMQATCKLAADWQSIADKTGFYYTEVKHIGDVNTKQYITAWQGVAFIFSETIKK